MSFTHLDDAIPEGRASDYLEFFDSLQDPTKTGLGLTADIGACLNDAGLNSRYAIAGGYGILLQLMKVDGTGIATAWKGFRNPSFEGDKRVLGALRGNYRITGAPNGKPAASVYDLNFALNGDSQHVTFFYNGDKINPKDVETQEFFGVPLQVRTPEVLLGSRLSSSADLQGNVGDTLTLLHIMEKRGYSPQDVVSYASNQDVVSALASRLKMGLAKFEGDRFGVFPTTKFSAELTKRLHKIRPVR